MVLGEMDVAVVSPYRSDQGTISAHALVRTPTISGGHLTPEGDIRSATYPVDDVHQARIT